MSTPLDITKVHVIHQWKNDRPLIACRISPDGQQAVSSAEDSLLQLWKIPTGEKQVLKGHESWVHALCYSNDSQQLVSGGCDGQLIWWAARSEVPSIIRKVDAHAGWVRAVAVSPDGTVLASVGNDKLVKLWNMATGEKVAEMPGHTRHIYSVIFHPNGRQLVTGDLLGKILVWNIAERRLERTIEATPLYSENKGQNAEFGGVRSIAFHAERNELIAGGTHKASNPFGAVHEPLMLRFGWEDGALRKSHVLRRDSGRFDLACSVADRRDCCRRIGRIDPAALLLFFRDAQEKEVHRFALPSLARDMDIHLESGMIATAHYDTHLRISG